MNITQSLLHWENAPTCFENLTDTEGRKARVKGWGGGE